jgi:hypothetical protein
MYNASPICTNFELIFQGFRVSVIISMYYRLPYLGFGLPPGLAEKVHEEYHQNDVEREVAPEEAVVSPPLVVGPA